VCGAESVPKKNFELPLAIAWISAFKTAKDNQFSIQKQMAAQLKPAGGSLS
jgi:hypothetical protein